MDDSGQATSNAGCVRCGSPLLLRTHETIQLLACPSGHGVFLHAEALQVAVRDRTADRPRSEEQDAEARQREIPVAQLQQDEDARDCPTCSTSMTKRVFAQQSGIAMDVCDEHGIWLDDGELQRIEAWYEAQERHLDADRATWGGQTGRLEQIEHEHERAAADDVRGAHWGPVGRVLGAASYWWSRRDDR